MREAFRQTSAQMIERHMQMFPWLHRRRGPIDSVKSGSVRLPSAAVITAGGTRRPRWLAHERS
jgi:hypothetical protein